MSNKYDYFARGKFSTLVTPATSMNNTPEMNGYDSQLIKLSSSTFN